jgi:hypothetical protein
MDMEAYAVVVDLLSQIHAYGESAAAKLELWISISSGLIVMAYFAPDRMKPGVVSLILVTYSLFLVFMWTNIGDDMGLSRAALQDAKTIMARSEIKSATLEYRLSDAQSGSGSTRSGGLFVLALFLGTSGYVAFTAYQTSRRGRIDDS